MTPRPRFTGPWRKIGPIWTRTAASEADAAAWCEAGDGRDYQLLTNGLGETLAARVVITIPPRLVSSP